MFMAAILVAFNIDDLAVLARAIAASISFADYNSQPLISLSDYPITKISWTLTEACG